MVFAYERKVTPEVLTELETVLTFTYLDSEQVNNGETLKFWQLKPTLATKNA